VDRAGDLRRTARFGAPETFLKTGAVETYPTFSPDGRWIAYVALKAKGYEVYVRAYPDNGSEVQVSGGGGRLLFWSRTARELIYETENHRLMAVPWHVAAGRFEAGVPERWSDHELAETGVMPNFDVAPDGAVIALLAATRPEQSPNHVTFRLNFFDELKRRMPSR